MIAGEDSEVLAQLVGFGSGFADNHARARCMNVDAQLVERALDVDAADGSVGQASHEVATNFPVLGEVLAILLLAGEPLALPVGGDAEAKAVRIDLLAHYFDSSVLGVSTPSVFGASDDSSTAAFLASFACCAASRAWLAATR